MTKAEFIDIMNKKIKLIRVEQNYSQEKMAEILSISKKTLVEIEKGRSSLGFSGAVCVAVVFDESEIIELSLGGDVIDLIKTITFENYENYPKTMGGKIWWRDIEIGISYKIQQNYISQHYRILSNDNRRICSSFDIEYVKKRHEELEEKL